MKTASMRDFLTGLTAIVGVAGLSFLFILFGQLAGLTKRQYEIHIQSLTAAGIRDTSPVTLNGVRVGQVARIAVLPGNRGVEATLLIREDTHIPRCVSTSVEASFVGETTLELTVPHGATEAQIADIIKPGETLKDRELRGLLTKLSEGVQAPLDRLTKTAEKLDKLADEYTLVGQRINAVLEPRTPEDVAAGKEPNVRSAVVRLDRALAGANEWLGDSELRSSAKRLVQRADTAAADLGGAVQAVKDAVAHADGAIASTADRVASTLGLLNDTLRSVQGASEQLAAVVEGVNAGKGTLGQLARNPDLYNSLKDASDRLEKALSQVELVAEKLKAEGVKVGL